MATQFIFYKPIILNTCFSFISGINHQNKHHIKYTDVPFAIWPLSYEPGIPISTPHQAYTDLRSDSDYEMKDEDISVIY